MGKLGLLFVLVSSLALADKEAPPAGKPKPAPAQKAPKQMSRTELEQEVEALRAENKKLKADYEAVLVREKERAAKMEKAVGSPAKDLK